MRGWHLNMLLGVQYHSGKHVTVRIFMFFFYFTVYWNLSHKRRCSSAAMKLRSKWHFLRCYFKTSVHSVAWMTAIMSISNRVVGTHYNHALMQLKMTCSHKHRWNICTEHAIWWFARFLENNIPSDSWTDRCWGSVPRCRCYGTYRADMRMEGLKMSDSLKRNHYDRFIVVHITQS